MSGKRYEFDALMKKHEGINAGFIEFPYDVKKEFGKGRVKVRALLDGFIYSGSLVKMGGTCHWLGITQEIRKKIGKNPGDIVHVVIEEETSERKVDVPEDFEKLMKKEPGVYEYFIALSYTHRKEYVRWISEAKKEETRNNRLSKAVILLKNKGKTPG
jgi:hypothetical protein